MEGEFVLIAREHFHANEKLCFRCCGPQRVVKAMNDHVYEAENLRNVLTDELHVKIEVFFGRFSRQGSDHVLHFVLKTEMVVQRLPLLEKTGNGHCVVVRWKGLPKLENTVEPIANIYKEVPELFKKFCNAKTNLPHLAIRRSN